MSLTHTYQLLPCSAITILREGRQRTEITTDDLEHSIRTRGVLQPIIVETRDDGRVVLIAGERRLTTCIKLGLTHIPVRFAAELPETERQIIELEENIRRKDLHWRDYVNAVYRLHNIYLGENAEWSQAKTAQTLGIDPGHLARIFRVAREIDNPKIAAAPALSVAFNMLSRQDDRRISDAMSDIVLAGSDLISGISIAETPVEVLLPETVETDILPAKPSAPTITKTSTQPLPPVEAILNTSFLTWAPKYTGKPFNFIHCDFPYGINVFGGKQSGREAHTTYNDSPDVYWELIRTLCLHLDKLMAPSAHLLFWFSMEHYTETLQIFSELAPSLTFQKRPLLWVKSDNVGMLPDPKRGPRYIYETALIASREDRFIIKAKSNAYHSPTDKAHHHSTKPEPMLRYFFEMFVDEYTHMLDPTCGSGSALRAAESLGAERVLGLELSPVHAESASIALRSFRALRKAGK